MRKFGIEHPSMFVWKDDPSYRRALTDNAAEAIESGDLARASSLQWDLGEEYEEMGDLAATEAAYRESVALARQVDDDPELTLAAFSYLIGFLSPSAEALGLAEELQRDLIDDPDNFHPMRAADARDIVAKAQLSMVPQQPESLEGALVMAEAAVRANDEVCFHDAAYDMAELAAKALSALGDPRAATWENHHLPFGHVHRWDVKIELPPMNED